MNPFLFVFTAIALLQTSYPVVAQNTDNRADYPIPAPRIERPLTPAPSASGQNRADDMQEPEKPEQLIPDRQPGQSLSDAAPAPVAPAAPAPAGPPQPVTLSAVIKENGPVVPDGLTWRIFDIRTDDSGQLTLLFRSEEASPTLELPPGEYVVHVSYGRAQTSDALSVVLGPNFKTVILDVGALRLKGAVTTQINIPAEQLGFDVYAEGSEGGQVPVALDMKPDELIYLNAGIYQVISRWGEQNASVRADIRVEPGQVTEATLFHDAARVNFLLVSNAGGEAIADVDWQVQNMDGETIYTHLGAFPSAILAAGDYVVFAQSGEQVYSREFQVQAGRPIDIEVLTSIY